MSRTDIPHYWQCVQCSKRLHSVGAFYQHVSDMHPIACEPMTALSDRAHDDDTPRIGPAFAWGVVALLLIIAGLIAATSHNMREAALALVLCTTAAAVLPIAGVAILSVLIPGRGPH